MLFGGAETNYSGHPRMKTLAARIERDGALKGADAVGWVIRLAKRIEEIHALGDVHGRISPECVRIGGDGGTLPGWFVELQPRNLIGYRSPERAAGGGPSRRDDTWAVAATLYQALTGTVPYVAENDAELLERMAAAPPPLAVFDAGDDQLQAIIDRALTRDAPNRFTEVEELRRALEAWPPVARLGALPRLGDDVEDYEEQRESIDQDAVTQIRGDIAPYLLELLGKPATPASKPVSTPAPPLASTPAPTPASTPAPPANQAFPASQASAPRSGSPERKEQTASRKVPLMGLSGLGLRTGAQAPLPKEQKEKVAPPAPRPAAAAVPLLFPEPPPAASAAPPPAPELDPAASAIPPVAPEPTDAPAHKTAPSSPDLATRPRSSPDLPPLLDEDATGPENEDPLAMPGSWTKLDAPRRASVAPPPPASVRVAAAGAPAAAPRGRAGVIVVAALVIVAVLIAWLLLGQSAPPASGSTSAAETGAPAATAPGGAATPAPATAAPSSSAAPAAAPSAGTTATAEVTAAPAPGARGEIEACMTPLFARGTFDKSAKSAKTDFGFVCGETDPRRGVAAIKKQVVLGGAKRSVSDGMREWALLGWYELASYAVMRARCCPGASPLTLPEPPPPCQPLEKALDQLGAAALVAKDAKDKALSAALKQYTEGVYCFVRAGGTTLFGYEGPPKGGQDTAFRKTLARVVARR